MRARAALGALAVAAALAVQPGAASAEGDQFLGQVESPDSLGADNLSSFASDRLPDVADHACAATSKSVKTSDKLVGYVHYALDTGALWVQWATPEQRATVDVPTRCQRVIDTSVTMADSSVWCMPSEDAAGTRHRVERLGYTGRTNSLAGALPRVDYFYPRGLGVPCYRMYARVRMEFRATYRTPTESGPVHPLGCVARYWNVEFYPHEVSFAPGVDWLRISEASPESACGSA